MSQAKIPTDLNWRAFFLSRNFLLPFGATLAGGIIILITITAIAEVVYAEHFFPKVRVAGAEVGRLTRDQASEVVGQKKEQFMASGVTIRAQGETETIYPEEIDLTIDLVGTLSQGFQVGRQSDLVSAWSDRIGAILGEQDLPAKFSLNPDKLRQKIASLSARVDSPRVDAKLLVTAEGVEITPSGVGRTLAQEEAYERVLQSIGFLSKEPILLSPTPSVPTTVEKDLEAAATEARVAVSAPLKLFYKDQSWALPPQEIALLLTAVRHENPNRLFSLEVGGINLTIGGIKEILEGEAVSGQAAMELDINQEALDRFVNGTLVPAIEQAAVDAKFQYSGGRLEAFAIEKEGRAVDRPALQKSLLTKLVSAESRELEIPVKVTLPQASLANLNDLGIKELLGRGSSRYTGSSGVRVKNLSVGAAKISGTLVPPDGVFSMYQAIGDVTVAQGFGVGLAIGAGNRSIPAVGGGICHVSTTLFRAILNSGLPILERHPHSYRIGYYEQDSQPGYDASVFFPTADFKFKNDTGHWILVQTVNDKVKQVLTFEIYGTSDGRVTEVSRASVYNVVAPGAPVYIDDPNLAVGVTKQVEFAVNGATSVFSRTVTRGGEVIHKDTFYSKYVPWKAVFLVGTKEG